MATTDFPSTELTTIILEESDHAKIFDYKTLVHKEEFNRATGFIENALQLAKDEPEKEYLHNTITLLGSRGSGKTSFLLSILEWIKDTKKNGTEKADFSSIQILEIIDPTLIEEKGHVFLNVIALISDLVEKELDKAECYSNDDKKPAMTRKEWRASLNKLAAGLPSIDGIGSDNTESWQDPEFVMDNGLKAVAAAQKLSKNFNTFLKHSLLILEKKAFLLVFDDIDVDSSKGWAVLETIRKYFTGSRLITLISGDLELYTTVIRQKKWKNFGPEILKYEGTHAKTENGLDEFKRLITQLTGQYMLKIMQPKYRVHLHTLLHRKLTRKKLNIEVAYDDKDAPIDLENLYKDIFARYGILNKVQIEVFVTFMLSQPLRSQIQFLREVKKERVDNNAFADIFLSDLLEQKVDISFAANTPKYLTSAILNLLLDKRNLEDLYQLEPTTTNESLNASLYTLSLILSNTILQKNRFVIFDFMIKIGYVRNLMTLLPYNKSLDDKLKPSIEDLCVQSGILHDTILRDVTGKTLTYLYGTLELENTLNDITPFFIQLKALKNIAKQNYTDRIDVVLAQKNVNKAQKILAYIPSFSGTFSYKNESRVGYSFYLLLGAIGEIVKEYETSFREIDGTEKEQIIVLLKQLLNELSQLRNYPIIGFVKKQIDSRAPIEEEHSPVNKNAPNDKSDDLLTDEILTWLQSYETIVTASHLLGKTTTRFFYAMNNIAEVAPKNIPLDELFHRQVIAFMNAVLIENVRESLDGESSRLNISNTNANDRVFINNLNNIIEIQAHTSDKLNFSKWMLSCPLLLAFLKNNENSRLFELLETFTKNKELIHSNFAIGHLLRSVAIRSQERFDNEGLHQIVKGSPQLLKRPEQLIQVLQKANIPYEWFVDNGDRGERMQHNNLIRQYISSVFLNDTNTSTRIKNFRRYLASSSIEW